ncbi:hypothetical protein predicted by Glimmer/Critica [Acetobacter senegalensis]|uniref:Uncharacterized protein n=1 Tax=Acetobacter senegalensis TaxID=446692 RepID=A0A0U5ETU9_9PROT|nr:hypothetical protein [Acetobacter senegalensis]CEF40358.1 hypothetical protein predicted by Glimmer/Critica [Acetobacter senegalensis]
MRLADRNGLAGRLWCRTEQIVEYEPGGADRGFWLREMTAAMPGVLEKAWDAGSVVVMVVLVLVLE